MVSAQYRHIGPELKIQSSQEGVGSSPTSGTQIGHYKKKTQGDRATDAVRVGIGHDLHRLQPGSPLRLGGIDIPHDRKAIGHSDADTLLHAVIDALLGAAALGDVGQMFPDADPENRGRDSGEMLAVAMEAVAALGWKIANIDCIVFAQRPKLLPHRQAIRQRLADILGIELERVGLAGQDRRRHRRHRPRGSHRRPVRGAAGEGIGIRDWGLGIGAIELPELPRPSPRLRIRAFH